MTYVRFYTMQKIKREERCNRIGPNHDFKGDGRAF